MEFNDIIEHNIWIFLFDGISHKLGRLEWKGWNIFVNGIIWVIKIEDIDIRWYLFWIYFLYDYFILFYFIYFIFIFLFIFFFFFQFL